MLCFVCLNTRDVANEAVTMVKGTAVCEEHMYVLNTDDLYDDEDDD